MSDVPRTMAGKQLADVASALWWQPNKLAGANAMQSATRDVRAAILDIEREAAAPADLRPHLEWALQALADETRPDHYADHKAAARAALAAPVAGLDVIRAKVEALPHSGTVWTGDPLLNRKDVLALFDAASQPVAEEGT